eukprot:gnl/Chilomastix_caulleri/400.p1 GENE.gnl/Chilomastix_caulleri/400~~gnl/Chilomastix_caulleri/400.p1  ORF type:complete len:142 (+),score=29.04 gnl/Chilomastix_caulleri/400:57-428(+)
MDYKIFPKADEKLTEEIFELVQQAATGNILKVGANEATKALNNGKAALIIIAADCDPIEFVLHLPLLCEDKNVPYIYIASRQALGRAAGVARSVIACAVVNDQRGTAKATIDSVRSKVEAQME